MIKDEYLFLFLTFANISYGGPIVSIASMIQLLKNDFDIEVYTTNLRFDNQQKLSNYDIKNLNLGYKGFRSNNQILNYSLKHL